MKVSDKEFRDPQYLPNVDDESILVEANRHLAETPKMGDTPRWPLILTTGSPRSGTTFLSQCLCRYLDVDYVDGLAAKFWNAPEFGMRLSRMVFGKNRGSNFSSEYGRTAANDIHGYHYFWMSQLKLKEVDDLFSYCENRGVDWDILNGHLAAMQKLECKPMVFKGYYPSYFMRDMLKNIQKSVFILIEREHSNQAISIYEARLRYNGEPCSWWSMQPPELYHLLERPPEEQIAGQVVGLAEFFERQIMGLGAEGKVVRVKYEELVHDPASVLADIHNSLEHVCGESIQVRGELPTVRINKKRFPLNTRERLRAALKTRKESGCDKVPKRT